MSKKQALRELVIERLMVAANEVFALIEQTFAEHEEEVRLKWAKPSEPKELLHKQADVPIPLVPPEAHLEHTEVDERQRDSLDIPFSPLKSEVNINKPTFLQQNQSEQTRERSEAHGQSSTSELPPGRSEHPPSCSDTDDSEDWETSADKRAQNDAEESDSANNTDGQKDSSRRKHRKRRKRQHELNQGDVIVKREREEQLETCMQIGAITDVVSLEASAQTSANTPSTSWMNLLTQQMQSTDPVVLMHEMLAKQDVLLQQQEQIFSLLSNSQLQIPECSLNYKDLPIRDQQTLTGIEAKLQDEDYRTKLMDITIQLGKSLPEIKSCTDLDCCSDYHCPFCDPKNFQPTKQSKAKIHLQTHFNRAVKHEEFTIHRCGRSCRKNFHYHCPYCNSTVLRKDMFFKHLQGHQKRKQ